MVSIIQIKDENEYEELIEYLKNKKYPEGFDKNKKKYFRSKAEKFCLINGVLFYRSSNSLTKRAIFAFQTELTTIIIEQEHVNSGHIGIRKMIAWINEKYYGISTEFVTRFIKSCPGCIRYNNLKTVENIIVNKLTKKYDRYMMDCVDLKKYTADNDGYSWILSVMDTYTKYLWLFKLYNKTAISVKEYLEHVFDNYGKPIEI